MSSLRVRKSAVRAIAWIGCIVGGAPVAAAATAVVPATLAAAQVADGCAAAAAWVEARFPEESKARWQAVLAKCDPSKASRILAMLKVIAAEQSRVELKLAAASADAGDVKGQLAHAAAAVARDPDDAQAREVQKRAAREYAQRVQAQMALLVANGKTDDAVKLASDAALLMPLPVTRELSADRREEALRAITAQSEFGHFNEALADAERLAALSPATDMAPIVGQSWGLRWAYDRSVILPWGQYVVEFLGLAAIIWLSVVAIKRWRADPLLILRDLDCHELAPGIEQTIQSTLLAMTSGGMPASPLMRVSRPLENVAPPVEIVSALPSSFSLAQAAAALMGRLLPRTTYSIRGALLKDDKRGAGISLSVTRAKGDSLGETLWADAYGIGPGAGSGETAHYALAEFAAIWLLFKLSDKFQLLGTDNWQAYALFRAGLHVEDQRNFALAKQFYFRALHVDARLQAARLNLALLAVGTDERALVQDLLVGATQADRSDATRYHARYVLAVREYDLARPTAALREISLLLQDIAQTCSEYREPALAALATIPDEAAAAAGTGTLTLNEPVARPADRKQRAHPELMQFLNFLTPIARVMWIGIRVDVGSATASDETELAQLGKNESSAKLHYNLACTYSLLLARCAGNPLKQSEHAACGLQSLERSLWLDAAQGMKAPIDSSLAELRQCALQVGTKAASAKFADIIEHYLAGHGKSGADPLELAEFASIGAHWARELAARGIHSPTELMTRCRDFSQREILAHDLTIAKQLVWRWAATVEMATRIRHLSRSNVNLLNEAAVFPASELAASDAASLSRRLEDWAIGTTIKPPALSEVEHWIGEARRFGPCWVS